MCGDVSHGLRYPRSVTYESNFPAYPESDRPRPQGFELSSGISKAWLSPEITSEQMKRFDDAFDLFVALPAWRSWLREHINSSGPSLYLAFRVDPGKRRLQKTSRGVSCYIHAEELFSADRDGRLLRFYVTQIADIYNKWADVSGCPRPPSPPRA